MQQAIKHKDVIPLLQAQAREKFWFGFLAGYAAGFACTAFAVGFFIYWQI